MKEEIPESFYQALLEIKDKEGNITNTYPIRNFDESTLKDKKYTYVFLEEEKIFIRNLFETSISQGFKQKNTFFKNEISGRFLLDDIRNA